MRSGSLLLTQANLAFGVRAHTAQVYEKISETQVVAFPIPSDNDGNPSSSWIRRKPELHNLHYFNQV